MMDEVAVQLREIFRRMEQRRGFRRTQKCLSVPPGLAPITVSERALARIRSRERKMQSWYLDL